MTRIAAAFYAFAVLGWTIAAAPAFAASVPHSVAVFEFELIDTSLEGASRGVDKDETVRLTRITGLLRDLLAASGKYKVVDLAPAAAKIADAGLIRGCNGCDLTIAGSVGAERAITGTIQKISTLILTLSIYERDVASGREVRVAIAQIRGNTDESWTRGVEWLVRNRLLADQ
jgi:hypothetical protein